MVFSFFKAGSSQKSLPYRFFSATRPMLRNGRPVNGHSLAAPSLRNPWEERGSSVLQALAEVPDPRSRHGWRHPLPAVLALARVAMLCGARSRQAMAQCWREQPEAVVHRLGFMRQQTPGVGTLQ